MLTIFTIVLLTVSTTDGVFTVHCMRTPGIGEGNKIWDFFFKKIGKPLSLLLSRVLLLALMYYFYLNWKEHTWLPYALMSGAIVFVIVKNYLLWKRVKKRRKELASKS